MAATADPVRVLLVGAGPMGRAWLPVIAREPRATLAGVVDLAADLATDAVNSAIERATAAGEPDLVAQYQAAVIGTDLAQLAAATGAHAIVNVTAPVAHHPVTLAAFELGLHVLGEKPATDTLGEAVHLVAAAQASGLQCVVSQNRRYRQELWDLRSLANAPASTDSSGGIGGIVNVSAEFSMRHDAPGFRKTMQHPLLMDMSIHHFDIARFLMDSEAEWVYCEEYRAAKDWYDFPASATCIFTMSGGRRFTYVGSWESPGKDTSWNAFWRVTGPAGTATWDGDRTVSAERSGREHDPDAVELTVPNGTDCPGMELPGSFKAFVDGVISGQPAPTAIADNVHSLAMVKAAIRSAQTGQRVSVRAVLDEAVQEAKGLATGAARELLDQGTLV